MYLKFDDMLKMSKAKFRIKITSLHIGVEYNITRLCSWVPFHFGAFRRISIACHQVKACHRHHVLESNAWINAILDTMPVLSFEHCFRYCPHIEPFGKDCHRPIALQSPSPLNDIYIFNLELDKSKEKRNNVSAIPKSTKLNYTNWIMLWIGPMWYGKVIFYTSDQWPWQLLSKTFHWLRNKQQAIPLSLTTSP